MEIRSLLRLWLHEALVLLFETLPRNLELPNVVVKRLGVEKQAKLQEMQVPMLARERFGFSWTLWRRVFWEKSSSFV
ncbi:hypothetical protein PIB30_054823 [Stylosanthes scabra]|uniref:Uncharacterized protein n=1 Tax=Stylosanthes scabra TaxID=79078 RepID=A0ABU6YHS1_9FABA|nr:hypothetical protein [Stylosanthes scabra]